jgi:hypothetical protein
MLASLSLKIYIFLIFAQLYRVAFSLSVVPSQSNIPSGVRAACRVTLAKNLTQCSDDFLMLLDHIPSSSLLEICTNECETALSDLYSEAFARCGTDVVNITSDGILVATYSPINMVGELRYRYNTTCLQDKSFFHPRNH